MLLVACTTDYIKMQQTTYKKKVMNLAMIISEKPVISMDTGVTLGTLKGLIFKNNQVTSLYCKISNKYVYIPIKDVHIGSDAIMLKVTEDTMILHTDTPTKVYTKKGEEVGTVTSIEMDDSFHITGIIVNNLFIEIDKILHMENIIIIETDKRDIESPVTISVSTDHNAATKDESVEDSKTQQIDLSNHDLSIEEPDYIHQLSNPSLEEEKTVEDIIENEMESKDKEKDLTVESEVNHKNNEEELEVEIDERYRYLCGKKLLEDLTIFTEAYTKGTIVDASLIQFAINNNAIVKLIMNTED